MIRLLFSVLFVSNLLNVSAQSSSVYTNSEGHYSFTPTAGWKVKVSGSESSVYAPLDGGMDSWDEKLEFSVTDGEGVELNDAFDFYINTDFPAAYGKFKVINQGSEDINGLKAKWAVFTFSAQGTAAGTGSGDSTLSATLQAIFYVIKKENSLYLVNGVTEKNLFSKFDLPFRTIIRTFHVKND